MVAQADIKTVQETTIGDRRKKLVAATNANNRGTRLIHEDKAKVTSILVKRPWSEPDVISPTFNVIADLNVVERCVAPWNRKKR
jgi:hypothetical protein